MNSVPEIFLSMVLYARSTKESLRGSTEKESTKLADSCGYGREYSFPG